MKRGEFGTRTLQNGRHLRKVWATLFFQLAASAVLHSEDNSNESMLCNLWNDKRLVLNGSILRDEMLQKLC